MLPDHLAKFSTPRKVLDHGFIRLVDVLGDDGAIVTAARVTTGKGQSKHEWSAPREATQAEGEKGREHARYFDGPTPPHFLARDCKVCRTVDIYNAVDIPFHMGNCVEGDRRLINYLIANRHTSPIEFAEIVLHVKMPIYVARQWIRHRTANVQEFSARYSEMIDDMHALAPDEWRGQGTSNRQGSAGVVDSWPVGFFDNAANRDNDYGSMPPGEYLSSREQALQAHARAVYKERIAFGVAREIARNDMPLSNYTEWYWKIDAHNLLHFLGLRLDAHAQKEIRAYADIIWEIVQAWIPLVAEAFIEHRLEALTLSRKQANVVRVMCAEWAEDMRLLAESESRVVTPVEAVLDYAKATGMSEREGRELLAKLGIE